jgi:hypothetical protein
VTWGVPSQLAARTLDSPLYALVHGDANPWTSAARPSGATHRLRSSGFAFVNRAGGKIVELIRLCPENVSVETDEL